MRHVTGHPPQWLISEYVGSELEPCSRLVHNWKSYWSSQIHPFITGDVLEVGAGIGSNTPFLDSGGNGRWVCLEPDSRLAALLTENLRRTARPRQPEIVSGTLQGLDASQKFDTIIYIDVLEHIENDRAELENAASRLRARGRIIVLSPAHQRLFTPFDAAIGPFPALQSPHAAKYFSARSAPRKTDLS